MSKYALCFLLIPMHSVFATGWNDYDTELRRGYRLVRTNAEEITIYRENTGFVVPPRIVALNIHGDIIFGEAERPRKQLLPDWSVPGFFILNTKTESVQIGLDEQAWLNALKPLGFTEPPLLRKPSRFFMWSLFIHRYLKSLWLILVVSALLVAYSTRRRACKRNSSLDRVDEGGLKLGTANKGQGSC